MESSILFAMEGANVLLVDINLAAADNVLSIINAKAPEVKVLAMKADVSVESDIKAAVDRAVSEFGRLDIMVSGCPLTCTCIQSDLLSSSTMPGSCIPRMTML